MQYKLSTKHRTFEVSITEMPDKVVIAMSCSHYGAFDDMQEFQTWLKSLIGKYDRDPRPIQVTNQHSGEVATVWGDESNFIAAIESRKDIN